MISSGINLVMTVIGFAVSTMFIVFVCTRLVCARIHLNASRRSFLIASRSDLSLLERGLHGLEPVVVANFPTKKYADEFFSTAEDAQCTVCLSQYHGEDILRILPYCGHSFHVSCIDIWLLQNSTCPVCRISLREFPDRKRFLQPLFSSAIRSQYNMESLDANSCNHLLTDDRLPSTAHENRGMDVAPENHLGSECHETDVAENAASFREGDQITKETRNNHIESPSNPREGAHLRMPEVDEMTRYA